MRLAAFIEDHIEDILTDWERFAKSLGAVTSTMSVEDLRDHAHRMLSTIVADMRVEQTPAEQEGKGRVMAGASSTARPRSTGPAVRATATRCCS